MDDTVARKLDELIAVTRAASVPVKERWLDAAGVAALLSVSAAHVLERIAPRPGFPAALRIGGTGHPRWKASEVLEWAERERDSARVRRRGRRAAA